MWSVMVEIALHNTIVCQCGNFKFNDYNYHSIEE